MYLNSNSSRRHSSRMFWQIWDRNKGSFTKCSRKLQELSTFFKGHLVLQLLRQTLSLVQREPRDQLCGQHVSAAQLIDHLWYVEKRMVLQKLPGSDERRGKRQHRRGSDIQLHHHHQYQTDHWRRWVGENASRDAPELLCALSFSDVVTLQGQLSSRYVYQVFWKQTWRHKDTHAK